MDESMEQSGHGTEGAPAPSAADALPVFGPAAGPLAAPDAGAVPGPVPVPGLPPAAAPVPGPPPVSAVTPPAAEPAPPSGIYDAPGSSDVAAALSASDDGLPGGPTPASSGFSWRVGGGAAPVMHSQGGIPNEFDHLFRDSDADGRRSLLPSQGPIGVAIPSAAAYYGSRANGNGSPPGGALPQAPSRSELTAAASVEPGLPVYQPAVDEAGYPQEAYPPQPYSPQAYQQAVYQPTTEVPVGLADTGVTGAGQSGPGDSGGVDERHTQAIPRVPVQAYGVTAQQPAVTGPDLSAAGPRRNSTPVLLISVGVFVVLIVIAAVAFAGGGKTKKHQHPTAVDTPTSAPAAGVDPAAKAQADAVYALIAQSKGLTSQANGAITDVMACKDVAAAQQTFTDIAARRQTQADQVKGLPMDKVPGGAQVIADLNKAWQYSADSERELAAWAADNASCTGKPGANDKRAQADADGGKAGSAKVVATAEWNAMAAKAGQPTVTKADL